MKELLEEQLIEYQQKFDANKAETLEMMRKGFPEKEWQDHAKKGAALKMLIEATILELEKYI